MMARLLFSTLLATYFFCVDWLNSQRWQLSIGKNCYIRGDNFSPRMPCQWFVRGGGEGKRRILIGQSVPPTPFGMAFGRLKLSPQGSEETSFTVEC
jgi:hypothetical protein